MLRQSKSALDEEIASAVYKWRMAAAYYESAKDGDLMEYERYNCSAVGIRHTVACMQGAENIAEDILETVR